MAAGGTGCATPLRVAATPSTIPFHLTNSSVARPQPDCQAPESRTLVQKSTVTVWRRQDRIKDSPLCEA